MKSIFILFKKGYEKEPLALFGSFSEAKMFKKRFEKQLNAKDLIIRQRILKGAINGN